jgi:hypothetical protein
MRGREKGHSTEIILERKQSDYETSQNPLYLIEAFLISRENGIVPPGWTLGWIGKGFEKYLKSRGRGGIDRALGFNRGKGRRSWFTKKSIYERNKTLIRRVIERRIKYNLLVKEACQMVLEEERRENRLTIHPIGSRRLKDIYGTRNRMRS